MTRTSNRLSFQHLAAAVALACGGLAGSAVAAPPAADAAFMTKAAAGGMAEVELSKVAQQKGNSDGVKQFAAKMIDDHTKAGDELKQVASGKGVTLPTGLDAKHQKALAQLQGMSGAPLDRTYVNDMLADHRETVALFEKEASSGKDADAKAFAAKTLPTLKEHLKMVQDLSSSMSK